MDNYGYEPEEEGQRQGNGQATPDTTRHNETLHKTDLLHAACL